MLSIFFQMAPNKKVGEDFFLGFVWFYDISTVVGYSMLNTVYAYILNAYMICKHILWITF